MNKLALAAVLLSSCLSLAAAPSKSKARAKVAPTAESSAATPGIRGLGTASPKKVSSRATALPNKAAVDTAPFAK